VATLCWAVLLTGSAWTLISHRNRDNSVSAKVLSWIFIGLALLFLARGPYFLTQSKVVVSISTPINLVNILTPLLIAVLPIMGTTVVVLLCFERIRRVLHRTATTDALTSLPNRRTVGEHGTLRFERAKSLSIGFSIAVIDIDHFNAERLRTVVEMAGHQSGSGTLKVTVSIGVATFAATDSNYEAVLQRADRAHYAAKAAGRNWHPIRSVERERLAPMPVT